jgi:hypothetical protein
MTHRPHIAALLGEPRRPGAALRRAASTAQRAFLIGCPRSGTTFLQAALSSHPQILSLPETAFFERLLPGRVDDEVIGAERMPAYRRRGRDYLRAQRRARRSLRRVMEVLGIEGARPGLHLGVAGYVGEFARLLDAAADVQGCQAWLEKTPHHVFYLDVIENYLPEARFIHLLRRGEDVVASAVEASLRYVDLDEGRAAFDRGIPWWVACWNAAVAMHGRFAGRENHCIVFYEDLVRDFDREYARLCEFIGVAPMRARPHAVKRVARLESEPWKREALSGRVVPAARKFDALFGPEARTWIREQLLPYDDVRERLGAGSAAPA